MEKDPYLLVDHPSFEIRLARNQKEIRQAQKLRFEVFNLELNEGLKTSFGSGLDRDEFDDICQHLIAISKSDGRLIGTYRLLLRSQLGDKKFYSENEFDLSDIKKLDGELLEVGRSCVHKDFRNNFVINLLWKGLAVYALLHKASYLFGCVSIYTKDTAQVGRIIGYLKEKHFAPPHLRVLPLKKSIFDHCPETDSNGQDERSVYRSLPPLFKGYLKLGAFVCGRPAFDYDFGTVDFFILLPLDRMPDLYRRRFLLSL